MRQGWAAIRSPKSEIPIRRGVGVGDGKLNGRLAMLTTGWIISLLRRRPLLSLRREACRILKPPVSRAVMESGNGQDVVWTDKKKKMRQLEFLFREFEVMARMRTRERFWLQPTGQSSVDQPNQLLSTKAAQATTTNRTHTHTTTTKKTKANPLTVCLASSVKLCVCRATYTRSVLMHSMLAVAYRETHSSVDIPVFQRRTLKYGMTWRRQVAKKAQESRTPDAWFRSTVRIHVNRDPFQRKKQVPKAEAHCVIIYALYPTALAWGAMFLLSPGSPCLSPWGPTKTLSEGLLTQQLIINNENDHRPPISKDLDTEFSELPNDLVVKLFCPALLHRWDRWKALFLAFLERRSVDVKRPGVRWAPGNQRQSRVLGTRESPGLTTLHPKTISTRQHCFPKSHLQGPFSTFLLTLDAFAERSYFEEGNNSSPCADRLV